MQATSDANYDTTTCFDAKDVRIQTCISDVALLKHDASG
jgi:hypothetical protein